MIQNIYLKIQFFHRNHSKAKRHFLHICRNQTINWLLLHAMRRLCLRWNINIIKTVVGERVLKISHDKIHTHTASMLQSLLVGNKKKVHGHIYNRIHLGYLSCLREDAIWRGFNWWDKQPFSSAHSIWSHDQYSNLVLCVCMWCFIIVKQ